MSTAQYPSLFIIFSAEKASFWRLDEDKVTELANIDDRPEKYTDHEGAFRKSGQSGAGEPDTLNARRAENVHHHVKAVAEKAAELWKQEKYKHLSCTATKMYSHLVAEALAKHCPGVEAKVTPGDYVHAHKDEIRDLFHKTLQPA